jgi:hypothetical protein
MMKSYGTATDVDQVSPPHGHSTAPGQTEREGLIREQRPIIDVSESDGFFHVYADFTSAKRSLGPADITVEFARQGLVLRQGALERYIPIPTDGEVDRARVQNTDGIVRISVPTAGLGHRWRSIIMW